MRKTTPLAAIAAALLLLGLLVPGAAVAQESSQPANLQIEQPHYASDSVQVDQNGNTTTYEATGERLFITLSSLNDSDVVDYGVRESEASLSRHGTLDAYQFETSSDGTYHVYWTVEETRTREVTTGNETRTETEVVEQRYDAQVVVGGTSFAHVTQSRLDELEADAQNWTAWVQTVEGISGHGADIEQKTQVAANMLNLRENPTEALTGKFWQFGIALFFSLAGIMWVLLFGFHEWWINGKLRSKLNELQDMLPEMDELEEKLSELEHKEDLQAMATTRPTEWYDDPVLGRACVDAFGDNMLSHLLTISATISGESSLHDRLQAMAHAGYEAIVYTDDDGTVESVDVLHADEEPGTDEDIVGDHVALLDSLTGEDDVPAFDALVEAVDPFDDAILAFDYDECEADRSDFRTDVEVPDDVDDLLEQVDAEIERFGGDSEAVGQYLVELLEDVVAHPNTGRDGAPDELRLMLEQFYSIAIDSRDIFELPSARFQCDVIKDILADHDPVEEAERVVERDEIGKPTTGD